MRSQDPGNTGVFYFLPSSDRQQSTPVVQLDKWYAEHGQSRSLHLIKIDVEGAELPVLNSAREIVRRYCPILYVEVNLTALQRFNTTLNESAHRLPL
jgi:FkbM family methyltransferase